MESLSLQSHGVPCMEGNLLPYRKTQWWALFFILGWWAAGLPNPEIQTHRRHFFMFSHISLSPPCFTEHFVLTLEHQSISICNASCTLFHSSDHKLFKLRMSFADLV